MFKKVSVSTAPVTMATANPVSSTYVQQTNRNGKLFHDEFMKVVQSRGRAGSITCSLNPGRPNRPENGVT
jgi:hypothetical protein